MGPPPTSDRPPARPPQWPALDGLRGLAVAAVIAYHLGHLPGGFLGVDLFFVLSGFLITTLLLREAAATGRIGLGQFWVRRARRLLPALGVTLVGVAVGARLWLDHSRLAEIRVDALATAAYVANWRFARQPTAGYFAADPSPLRHTWSLAIEEQYYLLWPLLVVAAVALASRRGRSGVAAVAAVAALGAVASAGWMAARAGSWSIDRLYLGTDTRVVAPLVGALLACALLPRPDGSRKAGPRLVARLSAPVAAVSLVALGVATVLVSADDGWLYRGGFALMALAAAAVVAGGVLAGDGAMGRVLALAPLRWVGERSYGLYLYSWPIQIFATAQGLSGARLAAITVGGATAVAEASHRWLETPIRRGGRASHPSAEVGTQPDAAPPPRMRRPAVLAGLGTALVLAVVVAATVTSARPDPLALLSDDELRAGAERPALTPDVGAADPASPTRDGLRVLVVGDSVGYTIGRYVPDELEGVGTVDARALPGCGLITEGERPPEAVAAGAPARYEDCAEPVADADRLGLEGEPDVVLLVTGAWERSDHERDGATVGPGDEEWAEEMRRLLDARVTDLSAEGAVVALWSDPCGADEDTRARQLWFVDEVLRPIDTARSEARMVLPSEVTCDGGRARTDIEGVGDPRPDDGQHFSEPGAHWLWQEWLGPALRRLATLNDDEGAVRALIAGDSVGFTLAFFGARGAAEAGVEVVPSTATIGCGLLREGRPADGRRSLAEQCGQVTPAEDAAVGADAATPDVVLVAWGAWEVAGVDDLPGTGTGRPRDPAYDAYVRALLVERLETLGAAGSEVALLGIDCWPPINEYRQPDRLAWWRALARDAAAEAGATYLDPTEVLCHDDGAPRHDVPGVGDPRPGDGAHFDEPGAAWFWDAWLGPRLRNLAHT